MIVGKIKTSRIAIYFGSTETLNVEQLRLLLVYRICWERQSMFSARKPLCQSHMEAPLRSSREHHFFSIFSQVYQLLLCQLDKYKKEHHFKNG